MHAHKSSTNKKEKGDQSLLRKNHIHKQYIKLASGKL